MTLKEAIESIHKRRENMLRNAQEAEKSKDAQMARFWQYMASAFWDAEGILLQVPECEKLVLEACGAEASVAEWKRERAK